MRMFLFFLKRPPAMPSRTPGNHVAVLVDSTPRSSSSLSVIRPACPLFSASLLPLVPVACREGDHQQEGGRKGRCKLWNWGWSQRRLCSNLHPRVTRDLSGCERSPSTPDLLGQKFWVGPSCLCAPDWQKFGKCGPAWHDQQTTVLSA